MTLEHAWRRIISSETVSLLARNRARKPFLNKEKGDKHVALSALSRGFLERQALTNFENGELHHARRGVNRHLIAGTFAEQGSA